MLPGKKRKCFFLPENSKFHSQQEPWFLGRPPTKERSFGGHEFGHFGANINRQASLRSAHWQQWLPGCQYFHFIVHIGAPPVTPPVSRMVLSEPEQVRPSKHPSDLLGKPALQGHIHFCTIQSLPLIINVYLFPPRSCHHTKHETSGPIPSDQ